jgi:hypothetical protein
MKRHYFIADWLDMEIDFCSWVLGIFWRSNYLRIEILFLSITFYWG